MKTITIRLESDKDAELFDKWLKETKFEYPVESYVEDDDDEELQMFEERMAEYRKDPSQFQDMDEFISELKKKHGL